MHKLLFDLTLVIRQIRRSPGFAATSVTMLAFGIGVTTAVFSMINGVLLRPLPFPSPDQLITLGDQLAGTNWGEQDPGYVTGPEVIAYCRDSRAFASLGAYDFANYELSSVGEPAQVTGARMTAGVFATLEVAPLLGRVFSVEEDDQRVQVAVLSYATWKGRFGGNPQILGSKILLDRKPYIIIGVMPKSFEFPIVPGRLNRIELWVPMSFTPEELSATAQASWYLQMVGRLNRGITLAQAENDAERIAQQTMHNFLPKFASYQIRAVIYPLRDITVLRARPLLRILFMAVLVVLLIVCANFAGLLLVRAIRRQREIAIRIAIGTPATALLRYSIVESLILTVTGASLGIGLAALMLNIGKNFLPETLPRINEIVLNRTAVAFALFLAVSTGAFCGLAPAFAALRNNVNAWLKDGGRSGSEGSHHTRLRSTLVVFEIGIALLLFMISGLLLRSFEKMNTVDLGFQPDQTIMAAYSLPERQYATQPLVDMFNSDLLLRLRQLPGTEAAAIGSNLPSSGNAGVETFIAESYQNVTEGMSSASPCVVKGDYFRALGIPLLRGRFFEDGDKADNELVVIVNQKLAEHYWPHQDPIGKRIRIGPKEGITPWMKVIGEIADVKLNSPDTDANEQFYQPAAQLAKDVGSTAPPSDVIWSGGYIILRSALSSENMKNSLRTIVHSIDPELPLVQVQTMDELVSSSKAPRRFNTVVIAIFALTAVLLAVLGIYSVVAFSMASRVQEMAIRIALGSQRWQIMKLVFESAGKLAIIGCASGLGAGIAVSRLARSLLFHVSPFDPSVICVTTVAVFLLAVAASMLPALRAASVNPMQVLRSE